MSACHPVHAWLIASRKKSAASLLMQRSSLFLTLNAPGSALGIRHKSQMTGSLDRSGQRSLMSRAGTGDPSGKDLAALRHILAKLRDVFVIDRIVFAAKYTDFLFSMEAASFSERRVFSLGISHIYLL
jgi:hypothetical protein